MAVPPFVDGAPLTGAQLNTLSPGSATVATSQTTTSATYADLGTVGPAVPMTTSTHVIVAITCDCANSGANDNFVGVAVSGATTLAAADATALRVNGTAGGRVTAFAEITGLTAGANTFTLKYRTSGGTFTAKNRHVAVFNLP